jgi:hypothetical protein
MGLGGLRLQLLRCALLWSSPYLSDAVLRVKVAKSEVKESGVRGGKCDI